MKRPFFFSLILVFSLTNIAAQQVHFLYFQTETNQPFYIKLDNKVSSSSASGYLILPQLKEGNYKFILGFPKNEWPEEVINYPVAKDAGFLLKNFPDKGWGLFDLQSLNIIMPGEKLVNNNKTEEDTNSNKDGFSEMLAAVVNDSTIKQKDVIVKKEIVPPIKQNDSAGAEINTPVASILSTTGSSVQSLYSVISKNAQVKNKDGIRMVYADEYNGNTDTISVFMPAEKRKEKKGIKKDVATNTNTETDSVKNTEQQLMANPSPVQEQKKDTLITMADTTKSKSGEDKTEFLPAKTGMVNSNCRQYATEDDFLKLRKKMAAETDDDNMITTAKKGFKAKCFTTKDIKNLSALFLSDSGKYNFFDAAYPYVSDSDQFYTLENQLSDQYYIKRFKAMINQ